MKKIIQLNKPRIHQESKDNILEVLDSGWIGLGKKVEEFEKAISEYLNTPFVVATDSGTTALYLALVTANLPHGCFVITTPNTYVSTNHSILEAGLMPVFADIEAETGNISPESVLALLSIPVIKERTKALMLVHYSGLPVNLEFFYDLANSYNFKIIEDCAHAFGAEYKGEKIGCKNTNFGCFSFQAVKNLCTGDGGVFTTTDPKCDELARKLRWNGINLSTAQRVNQKSGVYQWDYDVEYVGKKGHMNDIVASIGLGQLKHIDEDNAIRERLVQRYRSNLKDVEWLSFQPQYEERKSSNHILPILTAIPPIKLDLMMALAEAGIQTGCHYKPNTYYPMYFNTIQHNLCPAATDFFQREISLPLHTWLTDEDVDYVCEKIKEAIDVTSYN